MALNVRNLRNFDPKYYLVSVELDIVRIDAFLSTSIQKNWSVWTILKICWVWNGNYQIRIYGDDGPEPWLWSVGAVVMMGRSHDR